MRRPGRSHVPTRSPGGSPTTEWPPFRRLTQVQIGHAAADAAVAVALANTLFFAVPLGEARDKVALYLVMTMAPFALLSPLVGPILDRTEVPIGSPSSVLASAAACSQPCWPVAPTD